MSPRHRHDDESDGTRLRAVDPWRTEDPGYSLREVYTRSVDDKGHGNAQRVTLTPGMASNINALVQSNKIPVYKTAQDVIRDALVHRLHYINQVMLVHPDPVFEQWVRQEMIEARAEQRKRQIETYKRVGDKLEETLRLATQERDVDNVIRTLDDVRDAIENTPPPYDERLKGMLTQYRDRSGRSGGDEE